MPRTVGSCSLNISADGDSTTSLGNLIQPLTTVTVKKCRVQMEPHVLKFVALVLSVGTTEKILAPFSSFLPIRCLYRAVRSLLILLFYRLNSPRSLSLSWHERCSSPSVIAAWSWTCSSKSESFLHWQARSWYTGLQVWTDQSWAEGKDHITWPAGNTLPNFSNIPNYLYSFYQKLALVS